MQMRRRVGVIRQGFFLTQKVNDRGSNAPEAMKFGPRAQTLHSRNLDNPATVFERAVRPSAQTLTAELHLPRR